MSQITVAKFKDVASGLQPGQFAVGERTTIRSLSELDPIYKALLDRPITVTLGLLGPDGRIGLTPMWFDYEGDKIWTKYTGQAPPYGLRDPAIDEKRVLFVCRIDRIATFGKP